MTDLSEKSLEAALIELRSLLRDQGNCLAIKATKIFYRPEDILRMGNGDMQRGIDRLKALGASVT